MTILTPSPFYFLPLPLFSISQPLLLSFFQQTFLSLSIINSSTSFYGLAVRVGEDKDCSSLSLLLFMTNWEQVVENTTLSVNTCRSPPQKKKKIHLALMKLQGVFIFLN